MKHFFIEYILVNPIGFTGHPHFQSARTGFSAMTVLKTMFIAKLKLAVGAVMVVTALGVTGLAYRAVGQSAPAESKPRTELEKLRRENELLKLNLEVVLEKVRAQETELRAFKAREEQVRNFNIHWVEKAAVTPEGKILTSEGGRVFELDKATGQLVNVRDKEEQQRAVDAMEKALKKLREQSRLKKLDPKMPGGK